eukprot:gene21592-biopygen7456
MSRGGCSQPESSWNRSYPARGSALRKKIKKSRVNMKLREQGTGTDEGCKPSLGVRVWWKETGYSWGHHRQIS